MWARHWQAPPLSLTHIATQLLSIQCSHDHSPVSVGLSGCTDPPSHPCVVFQEAVAASCVGLQAPTMHAPLSATRGCRCPPTTHKWVPDMSASWSICAKASSCWLMGPHVGHMEEHTKAHLQLLCLQWSFRPPEMDALTREIQAELEQLSQAVSQETMGLGQSRLSSAIRSEPRAIFMCAHSNL